MVFRYSCNPVTVECVVFPPFVHIDLLGVQGEYIAVAVVGRLLCVASLCAVAVNLGNTVLGFSEPAQRVVAVEEPVVTAWLCTPLPVYLCYLACV